MLAVNTALLLLPMVVIQALRVPQILAAYSHAM